MSYSYPNHKGAESCLTAAMIDVKDSHNVCIWYLYNSIYLVHSLYLRLRSEGSKAADSEVQHFLRILYDRHTASRCTSTKYGELQSINETLHEGKGQFVNMNRYEPD